MLPNVKQEGAWKFERGVWSKVGEVIFSWLRGKEGVDLSDALREAGYTEAPMLKLGNVDHYGFAIEVYGADIRGRKAPEYPYYVSINLGPAVECVYVTDFPSLLMLLHQTSAIVGKLEELPGIYGVGGQE